MYEISCKIKFKNFTRDQISKIKKSIFSKESVRMMVSSIEKQMIETD